MNRRKKVKKLGAKTISFPKGKGHLTHNNREFISNNVVPERTAWNRIYIQESLEQTYEKCFGQALMEYNAGQKRKDRRKENYLKEIENSGNKEKTFYENMDCQHFFRQIFLGYFPDIVQAFDTLGRNVYGDDYTSLHNPIVLSSVLLVYGMFHSTQILF